MLVGGRVGCRTGLDADSAEQAVEKAKEQAENHYPEYEKFEVQAIEIERRSK